MMDYMRARLNATNDLVLMNRADPPDTILREMRWRTGDRPFARIEDVIAREEPVALSENYRRVTDFERERLAQRAAPI